MHVSPARFAAKTDVESKLIGLNWANAIGSNTINAATWTSEPSGLAFSAPVVSGAMTQVLVGGGVAGTSYRVRHTITVAETGEVLEASTGDVPGVPLEVLGRGPVAAGLAYRSAWR